MKYKFTANTTTFQAKPNKGEAAQINSGFETATINSIEGFIEDIEQGIT